MGLDDEDIGNNELCYKQFNPVATGATVVFICDHTLYGDWVSVNKTDESPGYDHLQLCEVRIFGSNASEYIHRIDLIYKFQNVPLLYPTMLHSEQKCVYFCSEWSNVG